MRPLRAERRAGRLAGRARRAGLLLAGVLGALLAPAIMPGTWTALASPAGAMIRESVGPESSGPTVMVSREVETLEEIARYSVAILHGGPGQGGAGARVAGQGDAGAGGFDAGVVRAAIERKGMVAEVLPVEEFAVWTRGSAPLFDAVVVPPELELSPGLAQAIAAFARRGGDLVLLGGAGIELARIDTGIGLPAFSPHEPYELYDLAGSESVVATGYLARALAGGSTAQAAEAAGSAAEGGWPGDAVGSGAAAGWPGEATMFRGEVQGHSAVGYVYPGASHYLPLLAAKDTYGRVRGWAAGALVHYGGPYKGGQWLLAGVTTSQFYGTPGFVAFVTDVLGLFQQETLVETALRVYQDKQRAREAFTTQAPSPPEPSPGGSIRRSEDGRWFVDPSGAPFFMIGANYAGPVGYGFGFGNIDVRAIEDDFAKASWAGVNVFRLWSAADANPTLRRVLGEMARKYGIYLLIVLPHPSEMATIEAYLERVRRIARAWAGEPMVIGYDLANEPDIQRIGGIRYAGKPTAVLELAPFERFRSYVETRKIENEVRSNAYPGNPPHTSYEENLHLRAARDLWLGVIAGRATQRGRDYSTLSRFAGSVEVPSALVPLHEAVEATFAQWIESLAGAIRQIAPHQLITVGYDQFYAVLDANERLDFVSHHVYQRPVAYAEVEKNLTTLDRLRLKWPAKPLTYGEFGYSSGYMMPDGEMLDPHTAAVGEIMFFLDGFAKGYSGAMIWLLNERPIANMRYNEPWMQGPDLRYEERLGMFYYDGDGTLGGRPKPIAHAMRFFARWAQRHTPGQGEFTLTRGGTRLGAGYVFKAEDALFVGDVAYDGPGLSFRSPRAVNVMLMRVDDTLELMATADVTVRLEPGCLMARSVAGSDGGAAGEDGATWPVTIDGFHGGARWDGGVLEIELLEGEMVTLALGKF